MKDLQDQTIEAAISAVASKFTYASTWAGVIGWLASSEATVLISLGIAVSSFFVNWYYKHQQHKREKSEYEQRMGLYE